MKLDKFAIIDALESGNNVAAVQILLHHFGLGKVPEHLQIIRRVSAFAEIIYYNAEWYRWAATYGFHKSRLREVQAIPLAQIWFPL